MWAQERIKAAIEETDRIRVIWSKNSFSSLNRPVASTLASLRGSWKSSEGKAILTTACEISNKDPKELNKKLT
jgi:hypothetical protein